MKRKTYIIDGFKGQNSKDAPEMLAKGEMQVVSGGFINEDTSYDGDNVGTLSLKTGFSHEPIVIHAWKSSDGNEYILTWGIESGAGIVNYYNKTSDGAINTTFITAMPIAFPPEFVNWGNEYIVMLAGRFGNYQITTSAGTLVATATTDVSPANFGRINNGALYLAQETSIIHSAVGNPLRFTPTRQERIDGVYDRENRLILSSAGVQGETMGYEIWKGYHIVWTQYDCYIAAWDGAGTAYATKLSGYGLYGMKGWAILDDKLAFYSTYKQASVCYVVTGTAGGNGETFTVGQNLQVSIIEAPGAKKISDILTACPKPTTKKKIIAIDSKEDWDGSKISTDLSATGWDTDTNPGWVSLKGATKLTLTSNVISGTMVNGGGYVFGDVITLTEAADVYDTDAAPVYPTTVPTPTIHQTQMEALAVRTTYIQSLNGCFLLADTPSGSVGIYDKDRGTHEIPQVAGWSQFLLQEPLKGVTKISIVYSFNILFHNSGGYDVWKDVNIVKGYTLGGSYAIEKINLYDVRVSAGSYGVMGASDFKLDIGEIEVYGSQQSTGVITTGPTASTSLSVTGLAAGTADLGLFQIGYQGYNDDGTGGLLGATAPTLVEVGIGTDTDPSTWGSAATARADDITTAKGSITYLTAAELKTGFKLSTLIRTGGGAGSVAFTFAAGGTLYVRARVPATLQASSFASPMIDRIIWDFESGSARTSTFPMFTWQHKTLLALMTNSSSTECDRAVAVNDNGYCSIFDGVKWMAGFAGADETIVTAGKTLGKLGEGTNNLIWDGAASTDTPTTKKITLPKIKGINKLFARKVKFGISKFIPSSGLTATSTGAVITPAGTTTIEDTTSNLTVNGDSNFAVVGSDGCIYFLTPYVPATRSNACYIRLVKFNPITSEYTNLDVDAVYVNDINITPFSIAISEDKKTLYLFWGGIVGSYPQKINLKLYDIPTVTLGSVITIATITGSNAIKKMSALVYNNELYCAATRDNTADQILVYKTTNLQPTVAGDFTLDKTITTSGAGGAQISTPLKLSINTDGDLVLTYVEGISLTPIYEYRKSGGVWATAISTSATAVDSLEICSVGGYDYMFSRASTTISVYYKNNGIWTLLTTILSAQAYPMGVVATKNGSALLLYYTGTGISQMEFVGSSFSSAGSITASTAPASFVFAQDRASSVIYGFLFLTYYRPYKIIPGEISATCPLQISVTTDRGTTLVYEHTTPITKITYIPERNQDLRLVQGGYLQAKLTAYGQLKCVGVGIEYDEQEGSL